MIKGKLREIQGLLLAAFLVFALAIAGAFQLVGAAALWLEPYLSGPAAGATVGAIALAPLAIALLLTLLKGAMKKREHEEGSKFMESDDLPNTVRDLIETVQRLTRTAPVAAIGLALVAGFILMRHPSSLPLVVSAFAANRAAA